MKHTGKYLLWLFIALIAAVLCISTASAAIFREGDLNDSIHWVLDDNGTLTFSGSGPLSMAVTPVRVISIMG